MDVVGQAVEVLAVLVIVFGIGLVFARAGVDLLHRQGTVAFREARLDLGRSILVGLEILVAGDIIRTVATDITLTGLGALAGLIFIRTFLSFAIEVEITGRWPWRRAGRDITPADDETGDSDSDPRPESARRRPR
jgi:uncharacterized membrane protein